MAASDGSAARPVRREVVDLLRRLEPFRIKPCAVGANFGAVLSPEELTLVEGATDDETRVAAVESLRDLAAIVDMGEGTSGVMPADPGLVLRRGARVSRTAVPHRARGRSRPLGGALRALIAPRRGSTLSKFVCADSDASTCYGSGELTALPTEETWPPTSTSRESKRRGSWASTSTSSPTTQPV